jgi:hypothetical protein
MYFFLPRQRAGVLRCRSAHVAVDIAGCWKVHPNFDWSLDRALLVVNWLLRLQYCLSAWINFIPVYPPGPGYDDAQPNAALTDIGEVWQSSILCSLLVMPEMSWDGSILPPTRQYKQNQHDNWTQSALYSTGQGWTHKIQKILPEYTHRLPLVMGRIDLV